MASSKAGSAAPSPDTCTHFKFEHKVFSVDGSYFSLDAAGGEARFHMPLGSTSAAVSLKSLRNEFRFNGDDRDSEMLDIVEKSLRFVKVIRVNDAIPKELLDGSASWSVEDHHRAAAQNRVTMQLVTWVGGKEEQISNQSALEKLVGSPETRARLNAAIDAAAKAIECAGDARQEVLNNIAKLAHELSFLEALRDHFGKVKTIARKVLRFKTIYKNDVAIKEALERVQALMMPFIEDIETRFDMVDAQTCEIIQVLRKFELQVKLIRESRDDLHHEFMAWEDLLKVWAAEPGQIKSDRAEKLIKATYRFLAQNYPQTQVWGGGGDARQAAAT